MNRLRAGIICGGNTGLILGFMAVIWLPIVGQALKLDTKEMSDNRVPAPWPELKLTKKTLAEAPAQVNAYYNDHFGFRNNLIRWHSYAQVAWLHESPSPLVVVGKEGWLFYTSEHSVDDWRHTSLLTEEQLEAWRRAYIARRDWLAAQGIYYIAFMGPNKHSIYPEMLPSPVKQIHPCSRYDQLLAYLGKHPATPFIDVRPALLRAKSSGQLYKKTDTHWTDEGAFIAYQVVMGELEKHFPALKAIPRSEFKVDGIVDDDCDLTRVFGLNKLMPEKNMRLTPPAPRRAVRTKQMVYTGLSLPPHMEPIVMESPGGRSRAVVFRDSFFTALIPFVAAHFARSVYIWHRQFDAELILREKPTVVIDEIVERGLWRDPPSLLVPDFKTLVNSK